MTKKNQREFHHVVSGAEKQTRNQAKPAIANTTLPCRMSFSIPPMLNNAQLGFAFHAAIYSPHSLRREASERTAAVRGAFLSDPLDDVVEINVSGFAMLYLT